MQPGPLAAPSNPLSPLRWRLGAAIIFIPLLLWLAWAAAIVQIDTYDGYDTICNARTFLGRPFFYRATRAPLGSVLIMPAEWLKMQWGMHPLDVRLHHATFALLHAAYLVVVLQILARHFGRTAAVLLTFVAAIPNYLFISYAGFLSHDFFPGAVLLGMLLIAERFRQKPSLRDWLLLVLLGAGAALLKHPLAVFWLATLAAQTVPVIAAWQSQQRRAGSKAADDIAGDAPASGLQGLRLAASRWALLLAAAVCSGIITWVGLAFALQTFFPDVPFLLRPKAQFSWLSSQYTTTVFPLWLYFRNLPALGLLPAILILPALAIAIRRGGLQRQIAIAWIVCVAFLHWMPNREVRYMGFTTPLAAFLLVPLVQGLWSHRIARSLMLAAVAITFTPLTPWNVTREALRLRDPFFSESVVMRFFKPLDEAMSQGRRVTGNPDHMLTFARNEISPLAGDRYHQLFHMGLHHLDTLYEPMHESGRLEQGRVASEGTVLVRVHTGRYLYNGPTWLTAPPVGRAGFRQTLSVAVSTPLEPANNWRYQTLAGEPAVLEQLQAPGVKQVVLHTPLAMQPVPEPVLLYADSTPEAPRGYFLQWRQPGEWALKGLEDVNRMRPGVPLVLRHFAVRSEHQFDE